ncbi:ACP S-malonyltransferase [Streptomyces sp. NPDC054904]|uniref:ACP S-malonyltransferase n=1 Tax=unclassified Streptomyces TaxID=2593676 RepID=UPI002481B064|nr:MULTISPECIES: ACP S-malonyltransferase [unclassified Streptomyces]MDA5286242.1 ACP S-malonyltransferase [Streptomyces sp. Isolate_45]MDX2394178.1 ACP S-malonyltransferase [Streptomyces sp. DK15]
MTRTAFVFPGQGSECAGMGRELLALRPDLADTYYRTADDLLGIPLARLCWEGSAKDLEDPAVAQPAVFLTSLAVLEVLRGEGLEPDAVAGHSLGEYAALVAAGVLEWTEALWLVRLRGELVATVGDRIGSATAAVIGLRRTDLARMCAEARAATGEVVEVAGENEPRQTVVSGQADAVAHVAAAAGAAGARVARLRTGGPFHSSLLGEAEAEFTETLIATEFRDPAVPLVSGVTGGWVTTAAEAVVALRTQLTSPVRWTGAVETLAASGTDRFVEVGPGQVLGALVRRILPAAHVHTTHTADRLARAVGALTATTV